MNRKIKAMGLTLVAVFALSAVAVSSASATPPKFTASAYPASGGGSQIGTHKVTFDGFITTCEVATFSGTLVAASSEITIAPKYEKCKTAGVASTVTLNGCDYKFTLTTTGVPNLATVDLVCPAGQDITIDVGNPASPACIIHVTPFTAVEHVKIENDHPGILATATADIPADKVHLTDTIPASCPFNGDTTATAIYDGQVTMTAPGNTIDIGP
jgi:hypothetical protein